MAAAAATEESQNGEEGAFEAVELEVLQWLLRRDEVKNAVRMAMRGDRLGAIPLLSSEIKSILAKDAAAEGAAADRRKRKAESLEGQNEVSARINSRIPDMASRGQRCTWLEKCQDALDKERVIEKRKAEEKRSVLEALANPSVPSSIREPQARKVPLYWQISIPEISRVIAQRGILPGHFVPVENPHVTLLYMGGACDEEAARRSGVSVQQFTANRLALEALEGNVFEVTLNRIVIDEAVACAVVALPANLPCQNATPHVTLGMKQGVPGRHSNEVLEDIKAGRTEDIHILDLPTPRPMKGTVSLEFSSGERH